MANPSQPPPTFTEEWLPGPDGTKFYTRTYAATSPRAALLFVHGFAEYVARYEWAHSVYAAHGITVFAFDQRGFGRTGMDTAHRSAGSEFCRTSFAEQLADVEWALGEVRARTPGLPVFLMGHSMGGGVALGFAARAATGSAREGISLLSGVVATSPLLVQTTPVPRPVRFIARLVGKVFPMLLVPAPIHSDTLTHDKGLNEAVAKDPLCPQTVSLVALDTVIGGCEQVLHQGYKHWPRNLPLLIVHGTSDKVTSYAASQEFFSKIEVQDKEFKSFEDGYHELVHEPNGVKEKFVEECIAWILARASSDVTEHE